MCITFFSITPNKNYKFLMIFNRDEFLARKTLQLDFHYKLDSYYKDFLFYPLDCAFEGTFLCINTKNGNFCCLLNNNHESIPFNPNSKFKRGEIPLEFCKLGTEDWDIFFKNLENNKQHYNGFNLICGNFVNEEYFYYSNKSTDYNLKVPYKFSDPGVYGVSNSCLLENSVYNDKVDYGKKILREILEKPSGSNEKEFVVKLFEFIGDKTRLFRNNEDIVKRELEKNYSEAIFDKDNKKFICSSIFVDDKINSFFLEYGTRHTICLLCDYENNLSVYEYFDDVHFLLNEDTSVKYNNGGCEENNFKVQGKYFLEKRNLENIKDYKFNLEN